MHEMNVAGARLARAGGGRGRRPLRRRLGRAAERDALALARRSTIPPYRAVTFDQVADAYAEQIRGAARGRRRPAPDRDDLRHAEREGGDRRGARDVAPELPLWISVTIVDLSRPHALRPDRRGVLDLGRARRAADRRRQLLARREGDAAVRRRALAGSPARTSSLPSERRAAERVRRLRRAAATTRAALLARVRRATGFVNIVGGCCGTTPGAHARDRRARSRACRRAHVPDAPRAAALQRPRAVRDRPGHRLRHDRRADERHRLGALPPPDRGGRLPGRGRRRARAGARRRQPPRREHGRRPARRRAGDDDVPQPDRDRARGRADPDHGRQLALVACSRRGSSASRARAIVNSISLKEGEEPFLEQARRDPRLRRRRRRDGVRRAGPGRHGRAQGRDLRPRLRPAHRRRLVRARGHRLRPERARGRDRDRGARRLREGVHRGAAADQGALPGRAHERRHLEPLASRSAATTPSARRCTRRSSTTRSAPGSTWGSSTPASSPSTRTSSPTCSSASRTCSSTGGPTRPSGSSSSPRRSQGEATKRELDLSWREAPVGKRLAHALVHGIVDFIEEDTEEARPGARAPARRDRGPADGRDEDRRRPLRLREDVPAAGREERARDEARGRLPRAVHGGGEGRPAATAAPRARSCSRPSRATCTTSARTSSASCSAATTTR